MALSLSEVLYTSSHDVSAFAGGESHFPVPLQVHLPSHHAHEWRGHVHVSGQYSDKGRVLLPVFSL
jgi:hypothetical protein